VTFKPEKSIFFRQNVVFIRPYTGSSRLLKLCKWFNPVLRLPSSCIVKNRGLGMDLKKLGLRIKELRKKKKLTQDELSELAGMNSKHLGEVERGAINISIQNIDKIAESLGVPLLILLDIEHQKSKEELSREIAKMVEGSSDEQVQLIHRVVTDIVM